MLDLVAAPSEALYSQALREAGKVEDLVIPAARTAGLRPVLVLINAQEFTKRLIAGG